MKNACYVRKIVIISLLAFFIISVFDPMMVAFNVRSPAEMIKAEKHDYDCYDISEQSNYKYTIYKNLSNYVNFQIEGVSDTEGNIQLLDDPMDSAWPMYCHDVRHTGQSPYSTANNPGCEKWRFDTIDACSGSPVIDDEGIIYIGSTSLYAVYPNGTLKWKYDTIYHIESAPTIDENGVIYFGTVYGNPYLFAIYTNNGTLKWKYFIGDSIFSSPVIGDDGSIYFGCGDYNIYALYPNGTLKWKYTTDHVVYSSPAIGQDGIVYCGSHDTYLYALYPNNGTLKWKYGTGDWIRTSPCIGDDGTIYVVSLDNYLHAVNPDGSLKWKTSVGAGTSPTIGQDGTIYCGYDKLYAINPSNGSVKWTFDVGGKIRGATPCNSIDGTIYFGTHIGENDGGELIAVNPDGTERWRIMIATTWVMSAPAIGNDGTIYVGSWNDGVHPGSLGYLHAINALDPDAPTAPEIRGLESGKINIAYEYTFRAYSPFGKDVYYWIEWGDGGWTGWVGPYSSGEEITLSYTWSEKGTYTIKARAKDTDNLWGLWGTLQVTMPRSRVATNTLFLRFFERFPLLEKLFFKFFS